MCAVYLRTNCPGVSADMTANPERNPLNHRIAPNTNGLQAHRDAVAYVSPLGGFMHLCASFQGVGEDAAPMYNATHC